MDDVPEDEKWKCPHCAALETVRFESEAAAVDRCCREGRRHNYVHHSLSKASERAVLVYSNCSTAPLGTGTREGRGAKKRRTTPRRSRARSRTADAAVRGLRNSVVCLFSEACLC